MTVETFSTQNDFIPPALTKNVNGGGKKSLKLCSHVEVLTTQLPQKKRKKKKKVAGPRDVFSALVYLPLKQEFFIISKLSQFWYFFLLQNAWKTGISGAYWKKNTIDVER